MRIQVNAAGYHGQPVTMLCNLSERTGVLAIQIQRPFTEQRVTINGERIEGLALVTNLDLPDYDFQFKDKHLSEAIRSFFTRSGQDLLDIAKELELHNPKEKIEMDGVDEGGRRYRIHEEISNAQMAILMAVAFVDHQRGVPSMIDALDDLAEFYTVQSI